MDPYISDPDFTLYVGDALAVLRDLPDESVHCVVTSPPYWGLRDYGTGAWTGGDPDCQHRIGGQVEDSKARGAITSGVRPGTDASRCLDCGADRVDRQLGLEPTPEAYVSAMVGVFRDVRRVLRRDGTLWLNIGDSYASNVPYYAPDNENERAARAREKSTRPQAREAGLKPKDLVGIPWRLAFALQEDGWYLRAEIIWNKPNPMPESVTDRPTKSHEQMFLLARSPRYFYDAAAVREPYTYDGRRVTHVAAGDGSLQHRDGERWPGLEITADDSQMSLDPDSPAGPRRRRSGNLERKHGADVGVPGARPGDLGRSIPWEETDPTVGRNRRSVWTIATESYDGAHFATFPTKLIEPCVRAGTSETGCCPDCGAPWERQTDVSYERARGGTTGKKRDADEPDGNERGMIGKPSLNKIVATTGWNPTCDHGLAPVACVVLDPFMGAGTTALVARNLGRRAVGIELNQEYADLAGRRLQQLSLLSDLTSSAPA